jgi:hypothetical protein
MDFQTSDKENKTMNIPLIRVDFSLTKQQVFREPLIKDSILD